MNLMNLSIGKKLFIILALGLFCLVGVGYLLYADTALRTALTGPLSPQPSSNKTINSLRTGIKDLETAELGYALSGVKETHLAAFRDAIQSLQRSLDALKSSSPDEPKRKGALMRLNTLVATRIMDAEQVIAVRNKSGWRAAEDQVRTGGGRLTTERIQATLAELEQEGFQKNAAQSSALAQSFRNGVFLLGAGYAAILSLILLAIAMVARETARNRRMGHTLRDLRERSRLYTESMKDSALYMLGPDGKISQWNTAAERLQGFTRLEIAGCHFSALFPDDDARLGKPEHCLKQAETDGRFDYTGRQVRKDGTVFPAHVIIAPVRDRDRKESLLGFSIMTRDITEQKQNEDLLKKLSLTVEQAADLVIIADRNGNVEFVNKAVEEVTGFTREEFAASGMDLLQAREQNAGLYREMWDTILSGRIFQGEVTNVGKNGELIFLEEIITPIKDASGTVTHAVITGSDLTPIKTMRTRIDFLASYDALTGLPNRDLLAGRLDRDMTQDTARNGAIAVLAIDIDRFKYINEIYGLEAGNKVLKQVAESLSVSVSRDDIVGRLGSDEFGLVLHDIKQPADVVLFVKMIMKNVPQIIMSGGEEISVTLAAGIAFFPADGRDALTLMKNADTALSKAKSLGRNRYQFYTPDMNVGISELVFMERRLTDALRNTEYRLTFQPYCHLSSRQIVGAEALLKWNNEEFGQVAPSKFIPMLEETGLIIDVGKWVMKTACCQIRDWTNGKSVLPVAVNLSPSQFRHEFLIATVESIVHEAGIDPGLLTLEITESTFMKDQEFAISVLRKLKDLGVMIAIDDFGTGYSSLSYLKKFPVDFVKIDQSFVKDVAQDPDTTSLVTAIITMAHSLDLKTIAEGIETEEQWKLLRLLKCDMGQGYYFSPAVSPKDFEKLMV